MYLLNYPQWASFMESFMQKEIPKPVYQLKPRSDLRNLLRKTQ